MVMRELATWRTGEWATTWWTSSAPAVMAPTCSMFPPRQASWWRPPAARWPSTATARCHRVPAAPDLLEQAGVTLGLEPDEVAACVEEVGVGFMFAPAHHSAMKHAIGPRKEMAVRTIFNILGPMTNPAGVKRLLVGVYDQALCRPVAEVLSRLACRARAGGAFRRRPWTRSAPLRPPTWPTEARNGTVEERTVTPEELGLETVSPGRPGSERRR